MAMGDCWSKRCGFWGENKVFANLSSEIFNKLREVIVDIELSENPDDYKHVSELFALYLSQQASEVAKRPMWLCALSYNVLLWSAWSDAY